MERVAIYPGAFDPITNGHIDVLDRASKMFDRVILLIAVNSKKVSMFTESERIEMAKMSLIGHSNVEVDFHSGLTVDYAKKVGACAIIRGIRAVSDFEYEFQIALMNKKLYAGADTIFLAPDEKYTYLNSSIIRELAKFSQDVSDFVPDPVAAKLKEKFAI
jgi:pantetheine-phosphate adenylyltransferase